jgi:hypothetical protein
MPQDKPVKPSDSNVSSVTENVTDALGGKTIEEFVVVKMGLSRTDFKHLNSFEEAVAALGGMVEIYDASEVLGDGIEVADKNDLINVPFLLTGYTVHTSEDFGNNGNGTYVVVTGITTDGTKFVFTDGSQEVGIQPTLLDWTERTGRMGGVMCRRGLSRSEYTSKEKDKDGNAIKGVTFHIDLKRPKLGAGTTRYNGDRDR